MLPDEKILLQKVVDMVEENNKMLHKLQGHLRWQRVWSFLKLLIAVAVALGTFYYLQPYVNQIKDIYPKIIEQWKNLNNLPNLLR